MVLDAGGGTVDATTYTVSATQPLRLKQEAVQPDGSLCGSTYLNERFREYLKTRLKDEKYLEKGRTTIDTVVDFVMPEFETKVKRTVDFRHTAHSQTKFRIPYLQANEAKGFGQDTLYVNR